MVKISLTNRAAIKEILYKLMAEDIQIQSVTLDGCEEDISATLEIVPQKHTNLDILAVELMVLEGVNEFIVV